MRIAVIGTGHVGLVTCATLANYGHEVRGTDADTAKINLLEQGRTPFREPGLEELVERELSEGRLSFSTDLDSVMADAEVAFICVGTPPKADGEANLLAVESSGRDVARHATRDIVVVEKSTVPVGTAGWLQRTLSRERRDLRFQVVSNPEFLREGKAVQDALEPDRILIGADSPEAFETMRGVYRPWTDKGSLLIETDIATAELAKHACNAFLALKISYINAIAQVAEQSNADVVAIADVMGADPRIGRAFLNAGLGYGGSCFPKDLVAFDRLAAKLGVELPLLREIAHINEQAVEATVHKVREALWNLDDKRIALLGLAFKPETDDVRFSPAIALARVLLSNGAVVVGYDPWAGENAKAELPGLELASDPYAAATSAHCLILCTEWDEFRTIDLDRLRDVMAYPLVVDGRNLFDPTDMRRAGFTYYPTGRPAVVPDPADSMPVPGA
ncbi:MAG TPA: UDP-glucose/GDP-mannose dehydrogenase family protein [Actinomycetota bacterium]|nr:UDP-glucose/GDP-mannose dehydrogenase family protein [Actinomycetota bacterium]